MGETGRLHGCARRQALCTPHLGFVTLDQLDEYFSDQFDRVLAFERGAPIDVINPEVLAGSAQVTRP